MKKQQSGTPLSVRLALTMLLLVAGVIVGILIINNFFLEKYYAYNKEKELKEAYRELNEAVDDHILSDASFDIPFERICNNGNLNILVLSSHGEHAILRSSYHNEQTFLMEMNQIIYGVDSQNSVLLKETENYVIERENDSRMGSEYLVMLGTLSDGSYFYIRTPLESIRGYANMTNKFFLLVGGIALVISLVLIAFLSRSISRPIRKLSTLSTQMAQLDFSAKYKRRFGTSREIDQLGNHMNELSDRLEQTILELKTANIQLQKDIAQKEKIDDMRKEFISNVSHELKTPLALISGYAEGLQECIDDGPESRQFYCEVIMDEADKMSQMVKKLLTLNQLEFGKDELCMERFDLNELLGGVINSQRLLANQENIRIEWEEKENLFVYADEFKTEEVIVNYLSNARNHADGEKKICIQTEKTEGKVRVSIFNTGSPIPEEDLDRIWDKFYKVDKARTREYGGSGIGLSIVKAIMTSMGQNFGVRNYPDGVEFWMELEAADQSK